MKIPRTKRYSIYKKLVLQDERSKELIFEADGREHYVYRVTDYTRTEKEHYYGSHTPRLNKVYDSLEEEFWTYRTSSDYNILNEDKKEDYKVKILKVFDNPADKMIYEAFLHQYFDAKLHKSFWNESNQTHFGFDATGNKKTSMVNKGFVVCLDEDDNSIRVSKDEYHNNSSYKRVNQNCTSAIIKGKIEMVTVDEFNDNNLIHPNKNKKIIFLENNTYKRVDCFDEQYKNSKSYNSGKVFVTIDNETKLIDSEEYHNNKNKYSLANGNIKKL